MKKEQEREIEIAAINTYGIESQVDMMIEETSELTKALLKARRYKNADAKLERLFDNICEELADVEIMLDQMKILYGKDAVAEWKETKLKRLAERLGMVV